MKINKKLIILVPIIIAIVVFLSLYFYYNKEDINSLTVNDRKWIESNVSTIYDFELVSNYPIYGENGIFYEFVDDLSKDTGLEFNEVPYLKTSKPQGTGLRFRVLKNDEQLTDKDLFLGDDVYITISKTNLKINRVTDFKDMTIGVFTSDVGEISYYLKTGTNITYKPYDTIEKMTAALDEGTIECMIIPNLMYLDKTIANDEYFINYTLTEMNNKLVLTLSDSNERLNEIIKKYYDNWKNKKYVNYYNENLLNYYISNNNINDMTKADLLSRNYVYGYVENAPYEATVDGKLVGISGEYINRIERLTGIDFTFKKYKTVTDLKKAIDNGDVDIYFNYYNYERSNYKATTSTFIEEYVVLAKTKNAYVINSFEALKGVKTSIINNNALYDYFRDNSKANLTPYDTLDKMLSKSTDGVLVVDKEVYTINRNSKFKDYEVLYNGIMTNDYNYMVKDSNIAFYNLFNYIINTNSYYRYRNSGINNLNPSIVDRTTFEQLYVIILAIIFVPLIILTIMYVLLKKRSKVTAVRKEERKKYTDMLTSLKNRNYLNLNIKAWNETNKYPQAIVMIDLNNVKYVNDNYGHEAGDKLIVKAAGILVNTQLENSEIIRTDGNEFLIYLIGYSEQQVSTYTNKLTKEFKNLPYGFGAALGYSMIMDEIKTIDDAINEATLEMRTNKEDYK